MPYRANYPATVREILNRRRKFNPDVLRAVKALRRAKPWRGTEADRLDKLRACCASLAAAYGIQTPTIRIGASAYYRPAANLITLTPSLSVVSFLHEFAHALDRDERQAVGWSVNLFRRIFPRQYARCRHVRHMLVRR